MILKRAAFRKRVGKGAAYAFLRLFLMPAILFLHSYAAVAEDVFQEVQTPAELLRFADGLRRRGSYDRAEKELREFLRRHPEHELTADANIKLIDCLRQMQRLEEAIIMIDQFQQRWPRHEQSGQLLLSRGLMLYDAEKIAEAEKTFQPLALHTDSAVRETASYFLGRIHSARNELEQAAVYYSRLTAMPKFTKDAIYRPYAVHALAQIRQQNGELEAAAKLFQRLTDDPETPKILREEGIFRGAELKLGARNFLGAMAGYELLIFTYPDSDLLKAAEKKRVFCLFHLERFADAAQAAEVWIQKYRESADLGMNYLLANALSRDNQFAAAIPIFTALVAATGTPARHRHDAHLNLIFCLMENPGRADELIQAARGFLRKYPDSPRQADIRYYMADALLRLNRGEEALEEIRQAVTVAAPDWQFHVQAGSLIAESLVNQGEGGAAAAEYRRLAEKAIAGENGAALLLTAGRLELQAGNLEAAEKDLKLVLQRYPQQQREVESATLMLADIAAQTGKFAEAAVLAAKLLKDANPAAKQRIMLFIAGIRRTQGQHQEAEAILVESLKLPAADAATLQKSRILLAATLIDLNKEEEGLNVLGEFLKQQAGAGSSIFSDPLLLDLRNLYIRRGRYQEAEIICRALKTAEDPEIQYEGTVSLAEILINQNKFAEAENLLQAALQERPAAASRNIAEAGQREELLAILGHAFMGRNLNDQAINAFSQALSRPGLAARYTARARWGMASILHEEGMHDLALDYASKAFILGNEPYFTPRSMWIAIRILLEQGKTAEARTTWKELQQSFPGFAEQQRRSETAVKLEAAGKE